MSSNKLPPIWESTAAWALDAEEKWRAELLATQSEYQELLRKGEEDDRLLGIGLWQERAQDLAFYMRHIEAILWHLMFVTYEVTWVKNGAPRGGPPQYGEIV